MTLTMTRRTTWQAVAPALFMMILCGCSGVNLTSGQTAAGTAADQPTATTSAAAAAAGSTSAATVSGSGGTLSLDAPTSVPANVAKVQIILAQADCTAAAQMQDQSESGRHGHQPPPPHRFEQHGHFANGRWSEMNGGLEQVLVTTAATPTPSPSPAVAAPSTQDLCVVQNVEGAYTAGAQISIQNIPDGSYDVIVQLDDASGNPVEAGTSPVVITDGQVATANITLAPVTTTTGTGSVNINISQGVGVAAKLALSGNGLAEVINVCGALDVQSQDSLSNAADVTAAVAVTLSSSSAGGAFYSDSACTVPVTSASLALSSTDVTVYYKDSVAGSPVLTMSDANTAAGGLGSETVTATITAQ